MIKSSDNNAFEFTLTQCKQLIEKGIDIRELIDQLNDQPQWLIDMGQIDSISEIQAIQQGGCASGAYMPAVTYHTALETMNTHGNEILDYIEQRGDGLPDVSDQGWSGMAALYCSTAVELWCLDFDFDGVDWD